MLNGFVVAMQPSIGLLGCCDDTSKKANKKSYLSNRGKDEGLPTEIGNPEPAGSKSPCGVGIGFLQDTSGALLVSTLLREGPHDTDHFRGILNFRIVLHIPERIDFTGLLDNECL
jgi:hypothetical protein